jgi:hypothetical protein
MGGSRGIIGIPDTGRNASPLFRVPRLANALMTISCKSHGTLITSNFVLPRRDRPAEQEATGRRTIRRLTATAFESPEATAFLTRWLSIVGPREKSPSAWSLFGGCDKT